MKHNYFLMLFLLFWNQYEAQVNKSKVWTLQTPFETSEQKQENQESVYHGMWTEQTEKRTAYASVFKNEKGDVKARYSLKPINYFNADNQLVPIDFELHPTANGWSAQQQPFPTALFNDGSFCLSIGGKNQLIIGTKTCLNHVSTGQAFEFSENIAFYQNILPHVDKQVVFLENAVKFSYRLNEPILDQGESIVFEEKIDLPKGYRIEKEISAKSGHCDRLLVRDDNGILVAQFEPILCFDAAKNTYQGRYELHEKTDGLYICLLVDAQWVNSSERNYPVYVDPVVAGTLSTWNGGYMPSCFMPNYNKDSILVTIPAGITATGVYVSGSFYADPFTAATMSQGAMYYSSSCGSSQIFTVTGATATLPGTAYLDSFNLMNPLSCCIAESCTDVNFWVRMHIGRNALGSGCNITYIRYDPFASLYPFEVIVYGKTPETYGNEWYISQTPICSNTCTFNATAYARYGVAPYTFSHPWSTEVVTVGQNIGCANGSTNHVFTLTNPNCPIYCDSLFTSLVVPPPVIIDACGQQITAIPNGTKPIIPATEPALMYDSVLCQGESINIVNASCLNGGISHYFGDASGDGNIQQFISNPTDTAIHLHYAAFAEINGCVSDTQQINVAIYPNPSAQVTINPNPVVVTNTFNVQDNSISPSGNVLVWNWNLADSLFSQSTSFTGSYAVPGQYPLCLIIQDNHGCIDSLCTNITVVPAEITNINVLTCDGDGVNDELSFEYLSFYPDNELFIYNRWGQLLYRAKNYDNSWNGKEYTEGTYFYVLKVYELQKTYQSFFELVKD